MNCCLGFYAWEFGQLKLGCRINAGAVDAYTIGNILFQSLRLSPIQAAFEHLVISFADVAYQFRRTLPTTATRATLPTMAALGRRSPAKCIQWESRR